MIRVSERCTRRSIAPVSPMPSVRKHSLAVAREKGHVRDCQGRGAARRVGVTGDSSRDGLLGPKRTETRLNRWATSWGATRGVCGRYNAGVDLCLKCGRWCRCRARALPSCRLGQDGSNAGELCMVWINKSITCPEKPGIVLILTLCEGKLGDRAKVLNRNILSPRTVGAIPGKWRIEKS